MWPTGHCSHRCRQNPFFSARKMHLANDEASRAEQIRGMQRGSEWGEGLASLLSSPKWNESRTVNQWTGAGGNRVNTRIAKKWMIINAPWFCPSLLKITLNLQALACILFEDAPPKWQCRQMQWKPGNKRGKLYEQGQQNSNGNEEWVLGIDMEHSLL